MKIRIGNDIRLKIQLSFGENAGEANILVARAFFVNTTLKSKIEKEYVKKNRFIGRFPIEPFVNEFEPTPHNINSSGYPRYHTHVFNEYRGFGIKPDWEKVFPIQEKKITEYESAVTKTGSSSIVIVDFPAEAQLYEGEYELVVVAQIYQPGYKNNARTVTANYKGMFELVSDSQEADVENPVQIEINNSDAAEEVNDVYVVGGSYNNDAITLRRNDSGVINVDVRPITDWYEGD